VIYEYHPDAPEELKQQLEETIDLNKLKDFSGKTILDGDYATYYESIYKELKKLSQKEVSKYLKEV